MAEVISGIYKITNTTNGVFYIGSAVNIGRRWYRHKYDLRNTCHSNQHLQRAWDKYGEGSFIFEILKQVSDTSQLLDLEQSAIDSTDAVNVGYNILPKAGSGRLGLTHSQSTKDKISKANTGHTFNVGRKHPKEYGEAISLRQRGSKASEEAKVKMSDSHRGKVLSPEHRAKITASLILSHQKRKENKCQTLG